MLYGNKFVDVFYWRTSNIFKTPTKKLNYHGVKHATNKSETRVKPQDQLTETGRSSTTCVTYHKHCVLKFLFCLALPWLIVSANDDHPSLPQNGGV